MIEKKLLQEYGAVEKYLPKGEMLFQEGEKAVFYYQIISGMVKMNNYNEQGQEMIQGVFLEGESFGEPPLFGHFPFPANAVAIEETHLICLEKNRFFTLLKEHNEISIFLLKVFSTRLRFKSIMAKEIKGYQSGHRIMTLLRYLKKKSRTKGEYEVTITRQTIADLTGLRVETVIRTIKKLDKDGKLEIRNHKLYL